MESIIKLLAYPSTTFASWVETAGGPTSVAVFTLVIAMLPALACNPFSKSIKGYLGSSLLLGGIYFLWFLLLTVMKSYNAGVGNLFFEMAALMSVGIVATGIYQGLLAVTMARRLRLVLLPHSLLLALVIAMRLGMPYLGK